MPSRQLQTYRLTQNTHRPLAASDESGKPPGQMRQASGRQNQPRGLWQTEAQLVCPILMGPLRASCQPVKTRSGHIAPLRAGCGTFSRRPKSPARRDRLPCGLWASTLAHSRCHSYHTGRYPRGQGQKRPAGLSLRFAIAQEVRPRPAAGRAGSDNRLAVSNAAGQETRRARRDCAAGLPTRRVKGRWNNA